MQTLRRISKPVSYLLLAGFLSVSLHMPAANAAMVGTDVVVNAAKVADTRGKLASALERKEVQEALAARGVSAAEVQARVDAMTDQEVAQVAAKMDELPAGGSALGVIVFVFIVLLITDLLGFTDVFPFTKKGSARR